MDCGARDTAEERKKGRERWSGDAQTKAELEIAETEMHTAWSNLKVDTKDAELRKAVRRACKTVKKIRTVAVTRFFERYVQDGGAITPAEPERFLPTPEIHGGGGNEEGGTSVYSR